MFATPTLFGGGEPVFDPMFRDLRRHQLDATAWVDYCPGWLAGHETLLEILESTTEWSSPVVRMYDNDVRTPRLVGRVAPTAHPIVTEMSAALSERYRVVLDRFSAGWYRDGADSVAWHGDRIARDRPAATVATVSLGAPRRFLLRPVAGGPSQRFSLGHGDLVVMGGSCQRDWQHAVPKVAHAGPRIALMFRHAYD